MNMNFVTPEGHCLIELDPAVSWIAQRLEGTNFELYLVGGPVRDALDGKPAKDPDCLIRAVSAISVREAIAQLRALLAGAQVEETGRDLVVITVTVRDDQGERIGEDVQLAFPRTEVSTGHRESDFDFTVDLNLPVDQDLQRRDLTVNAMAVRVGPGSELIDPFGGLHDLRAGIARAVGDPAQRFAESPIRMLRAVRFAARPGWRLDPQLAQALRDSGELTAHIERPALGTELRKQASGQFASALRLLSQAGLLERLFPVWAQARDLDQRNRHHAETVGDHIITVVGFLDQLGASDLVKLAGFFHDLGKPQTMSIDESGAGHFYGHEDAGAQLARAALSELCLGHEATEHVARLVELHMDPGQVQSARAARRLAHRAGVLLEDLLALHRADRLAHAGEDLAALDRREAELLQAARALPARAFSDHDLALRGGDIAPLVGESRHIGLIKRDLVQMVVDGDVSNEREPLLLRARDLASQLSGQRGTQLGTQLPSL